jgi:hypothetical protein
MDPATLALILGPQIISGFMQYGESQEAREYAQQQEARLQEALNRIGIPEARPEYFTHGWKTMIQKLQHMFVNVIRAWLKCDQQKRSAQRVQNSRCCKTCLTVHAAARTLWLKSNAHAA